MKSFKIFIISVCLVLWAIYTYGASQQTSSTTAATIIDRVEARLNDTDNNMWDAGDLLTWLNEGQLDIVTRTHCLQSSDTETLVADQIEYPVSSFDNAPWYYITIKAVIYINSDSEEKALTKGTLLGAYENTRDKSVGNSETGGEPAFWYEWGGNIGVYPALSAIDTGTPETIKVYYITRPTAIASSANITIPHIYEPALINYMLAQAYLMDNQLNRYLQTISLYENWMLLIRQDLNEFPAPSK